MFVLSWGLGVQICFATDIPSKLEISVNKLDILFIFGMFPPFDFFETHLDFKMSETNNPGTHFDFLPEGQKVDLFAFLFSRERKPIIFSSRKGLLLKDVDNVLQLFRNF